MPPSRWPDKEFTGARSCRNVSVPRCVVGGRAAGNGGLARGFDSSKGIIVLNAVQRGMEERPEGYISMRSDVGGFKFRRRLRELIAREGRA